MSQFSFRCPVCKQGKLFGEYSSFSSGMKEACKECGAKTVLRDNEDGIWIEREEPVMNKYCAEVTHDPSATDTAYDIWNWRVRMLGRAGLEAEGELFAFEFDDTEKVAHECADAVVAILEKHDKAHGRQQAMNMQSRRCANCLSAGRDGKNEALPIL